MFQQRLRGLSTMSVKGPSPECLTIVPKGNCFCFFSYAGRCCSQYPQQKKFAHVSEIAPPQVQRLALGFVESYWVYGRPLLKCVLVPLDGIPSLCCVTRTPQLGVQTAEGALAHTACIVDEAAEEHRSQEGPLADTTGGRLSTEPLTATRLATTFQPIFFPPNIPLLKSVFLQLRDKDVVWDQVIGLARVQVDNR